MASRLIPASGFSFLLTAEFVRAAAPKAVPGCLLIWREQGTKSNQSNNVERYNCRGGGVMVWAEISLGRHTDLHVIQYIWDHCLERMGWTSLSPDRNLKELF
ncbi:hypothetical protein TNCV_4074371 [Trichonephila clavipes]|uniref:Secreted protein n=1 Tax=Trichonephila clavipes TaxID=2585209 RepID=A0A8X7BGY3_TRICX|nr:hypothetical protein TNCV_4074371 [Trichonephila clavipes]